MQAAAAPSGKATLITAEASAQPMLEISESELAASTFTGSSFGPSEGPAYSSEPVWTSSTEQVISLVASHCWL